MAFLERWSPNCSKTLDPKAIMLHHTGGGTFLGNVSYLRNPNAKASAHFVIGKKRGEIAMLVRLRNRAWHAGIGGPLKLVNGFIITQNMANAYCIGIELVNKGDGKDPYPKEQLDNLDEVLAYINKALSKKLPIIIDHKTWAPRRKNDLRANFPLLSYQKYGKREAPEPKPKVKHYTVRPLRGAIMRKSPTTDSKKLMRLPRGKLVTFYRNERAADGRLWRKVGHDGKVGYIRADQLKLKG